LKAEAVQSKAATKIQTAFHNRPLKPYNSSYITTHGGDIITSYFYKVTGNTQDYDNMLIQVARGLNYVPNIFKGYYQILASGLNQQYFGQTFNKSKRQTLMGFKEEFLSHIEKYDEFEVSEILIKTLTPNPKNGSGGRSMITANKIWKIISTDSVTNCMYSAAVLSLNKINHRAILKETKGVSMTAQQLKGRINPTHKAYSDDVDMQELAT
jgi:hypothetical protein